MSTIQGQTIHLEEREWSRWVDLEFRVNMLVRVKGMAQFFLIKAGNDLQLYVSPVNWHPADPPTPMSSPASFAGDLFERLGPYRTLGWPEATWPLNEERIDEATFMDDLGPGLRRSRRSRSSTGSTRRTGICSSA